MTILERDRMHFEEGLEEGMEKGIEKEKEKNARSARERDIHRQRYWKS